MNSKFLLCLILLLSACGGEGEQSALVARVYDHELHEDDLRGLVGEGVSAEDSATIVNNYIEQWIRQMVILSKAEKNVDEDFSREMNEYHNSLLTYKYEEQIVKQLIDTNVSLQQIRQYYEEHREQFLLKNSIVKAVYVCLPKNAVQAPRLRSIVYKKPFRDEEIVEMQSLAERAGAQGFFDSETWMPFHTLQSMVPITTYNENMYLKLNHTVVLKDDSMAWYVRILDYKVSDDVSPIELQRDNIKAIILNHRRVEILSKLQSDLLEEAENGGYVKRQER